MAINAIPVDQRVIDIDSRRFASIEKALVELITNSDDSYARLDKAGIQTSGEILVQYERHHRGALMVVTDKAEGMSYEQVRRILTYGGAHSPLARGESGGRGYFGRGLKQAIYGLGHGWIETIHAGQLSRIELFRSENGGYIYDDGSGDRLALPSDYARLDLVENGTQVTIVIENSHVNISRYGSLMQAVSNNIYLRDVLERRNIELVNLQQGKKLERSGQIHYEAPPSVLLLGPDHVGHFEFEKTLYPFTLTLKRALDAELIPSGDERTNGLVVISDMAVLDCQLFEYENQVGTEYLFGTVRCPALIDKLSQGMAIISDEREGLNQKDPFVNAFSKAISDMIASFILAEQEKLKHLERASTSERTNHMIEHLLERMNLAAVQDLGIMLQTNDIETDPKARSELPASLRFTTPFYYRKLNHPFHVTLLIDPDQFPEDEILHFEYNLPESMHIEPLLMEIPMHDLGDTKRIEWTIVGEAVGENGRIMVRAGSYWSWCEVVIAEHSSHHHHSSSGHSVRRGVPRDHGTDMFAGYELRNLENELDRAVYSPKERKIIINTGAPTVQLYVDGRGHFRDSARLLLAELFMDVISDELSRRLIEKSGHKDDIEAYHSTKMDIIRRYGSDIHLSFLNA